MFDRLLGKGRAAAAARKAELRGELAKAVELWSRAESPEDAARVAVMRGDGEPSPKERLVHYTQAIDLAPEDTDIRTTARRKRALLLIALAGDGPVSATQRHDLLTAAHELEAIGEAERAAEAYARAGDTEAQARATVEMGDVEKLEFLLTEQQERERYARRKREAHAEVDVLVASGRRREALATAEAFEREVRRWHDAWGGKHAGDGAAAERDLGLKEPLDALRARRVNGPVARLVWRGRPVTLVLGDEVIIGRTEGAIQIASHAVSRRHLVIARGDAGIIARDLGSRNGTLLRGLALAGAVSVGDGLELRLGREVPMKVTPSAIFPIAPSGASGSGGGGGVTIEIAGASYEAPLGPALVPSGAGPSATHAAPNDAAPWRFELGEGNWLELVSSAECPAFIGKSELAKRATLLVGDRIAAARGAEPTLEVLG